MIIRKFESKDFDRILELNEESVSFLSPLTKNKLESLILESELINIIEVNGIIEAFILTLRQGKDYTSINYLWFSNNYDEFLYIDRIVVSKKMHGKGLGKLLYKSIFTYAKLVNLPYLVAEIDINPPNPKSLKFHEYFGFKEVGKQKVNGGKKVVSLQVVSLN